MVKLSFKPLATNVASPHVLSACNLEKCWTCVSMRIVRLTFSESPPAIRIPLISTCHFHPVSIIFYHCLSFQSIFRSEQFVLDWELWTKHKRRCRCIDLWCVWWNFFTGLLPSASWSFASSPAFGGLGWFCWPGGLCCPYQESMRQTCQAFGSPWWWEFCLLHCASNLFSFHGKLRFSTWWTVWVYHF